MSEKSLMHSLRGFLTRRYLKLRAKYRNFERKTLDGLKIVFVSCALNFSCSVIHRDSVPVKLSYLYLAVQLLNVIGHSQQHRFHKDIFIATG